MSPIRSKLHQHLWQNVNIKLVFITCQKPRCALKCTVSTSEILMFNHVLTSCNYRYSMHGKGDGGGRVGGSRRKKEKNASNTINTAPSRPVPIDQSAKRTRLRGAHSYSEMEIEAILYQLPRRRRLTLARGLLQIRLSPSSDVGYLS